MLFYDNEHPSIIIYLVVLTQSPHVSLTSSTAGMFGVPVIGDTLIQVFRKEEYEAMQRKNCKDGRMWRYSAFG